MAPDDATLRRGRTLDDRAPGREDYGGTGLYRDHTPPTAL